MRMLFPRYFALPSEIGCTKRDLLMGRFNCAGDSPSGKNVLERRAAAEEAIRRVGERGGKPNGDQVGTIGADLTEVGVGR